MQLKKWKVTTSPHRRYNLLTGEWVLVSPQRISRPWQGERVSQSAPPSYDKDCYLCPGNKRANNSYNPNYKDVYIFTNDFPALVEEVADTHTEGILRHQAVGGTCRVICYSPLHNRNFASMELGAIQKVIQAWGEQLIELGKKYTYVQIFENKGAVVGCSNDHPHGQIWASSFIPTQVAKEQRQQDNWSHKDSLLRDYLNTEQKLQTRMVIQNNHWSVVVPYWAYWPFETLLLPNQDLSSLSQLNDEQQESLAQVLKELVRKYDSLFAISFPYLMGWHSEPYVRPETAHRLLHCHFYPPLLRSAEVRKYTAAFELCAELQRDMTAEEAAAKLREI